MVGLVAFVLGATYLLAPLFSREATWETGGACSPTIFAVSAASVGIWQMVEALGGNAEGVAVWMFGIGLVLLLLLGDRWRRRRIVRPPDIMRRLGGGPSLEDVALARFEEKKRKEKEEAKRIVREEEGSREEPQAPSPPMRVPRGYDSQAPPHKGDAYQELRRLAELRDEGLLTPEEFAAKKRDILDRI